MFHSEVKKNKDTVEDTFDTNLNYLRKSGRRLAMTISKFTSGRCFCISETAIDNIFLVQQNVQFKINVIQLLQPDVAWVTISYRLNLLQVSLLSATR